MHYSALRKTALALSVVLTSSVAFSLNAIATNLDSTSLTTVEIKRDSYGVPHVFADNTYGLFYGYGYAVAQDRLFQMDMSRRSFTGRTAEVLGAGDNNAYLNYDISVRKNFTPASIQRQINALSKDEIAIFEGYAAGFNAYLKRVKQNPELLPKEYIDFNFDPTPLTAFDVVMIWVGSMANRFSDINLEVSALHLLQDLKAQHGDEKGQAIFDELRWINDPNSPTTVPKSLAHSKQQSKSRTPALAAVSTETLKQIHAKQQASWGGLGPDFAPKSSNLWTTQPRRTTENATVLINGPQFGWYNPSYTYGIGLHGAGFNAVGNTPFAYPIILFGTNSNIAWGATAGPQDVVDIYQEQLHPSDPHQYFFNGSYHPMQERKERIKVRDQEKDTIISVWNTSHGLVTEFDEESQVAYSKKRSWDGYEVQSLMAWINVAKAQNWEDFLAQAEKMAITINWYYADKDGNIGYVSPGYLPKRPASQDTRIPAKGDGSMEWEGLLSFESIPKAYNPDQGYLSNWNNRPAPDKTNTDTYFWTYGDRVNELNTLYDAKEQFSTQELWDFNKTASYKDVNWRYFLPYLKQAQSQLSRNSPTYNMTTELLLWDGSEADHQGNNSHPGRVIFKTWLEEMYQLVLAPIVPEAHQAIYLQPGFMTAKGPNPGSTNLSMGTKVLLRGLDLEANPEEGRYSIFEGNNSVELMQQALEKTYARLSQEQGKDISAWTLATSIHRFSPNMFTGTPQTSKDNTFQFTGYQNRGTENNRVIFTENGVEFCDAMPPGQSGFIDRDGKRSPHYDDQLKMYENFECKNVATELDAINQEMTEHTILIVKN